MRTTLYLFLLIFIIADLQAQTKYFVNASSGDDFNTGLSWDQAFENLQTALNMISDHDTIWVAQGSYYPDKGTGTTNDLRNSTFFLNKGVNIYGGFDGSENALDQRDWQSNPCILSGDLMQNDGSDFSNYDDNVYHVLRCANELLSPTMDGFIVQGGNADTTGQDADGAGMLNFNADPIIKNCTFRLNYARTFGAGMSNVSADPAILNCIFLGNHADTGGGMHNNGASPQLNSCIFEKNSSSNRGAGMHNTNSSEPDLMGCHFTNNHAKGDTTIITAGGGIYNSSSNAMITNCAFLSNSADQGGGIDNSHSTPIIRNSVFFGNLSTGFDGGAIYNGVSPANITNCSFSGNKSTLSGGAIYNFNSNSILTNNVIWNNSDQSGTGTSGSSIMNAVSSPVISYCLIQNVTTAVDGNLDGITPAGDSNYPDFILEVDPMAAPTIVGNLRVYLGSPLIDAGNDLAVSTLTDPDGYDRINDMVDIGAYENPAANCPSELLLTQVYSPLKGTYEAVEEIELADGAWIPNLGTDLILNAKEVILSPTTESQLGAVLIIQNIGCSP